MANGIIAVQIVVLVFALVDVTFRFSQRDARVDVSLVWFGSVGMVREEKLE